MDNSLNEVKDALNEWDDLVYKVVRVPEFTEVTLEPGKNIVVFNNSKFLVDRKNEKQRMVSQIVPPRMIFGNNESEHQCNFEDGYLCFQSNIGNLPGYERYHPRCFNCYFGKFGIFNSRFPDIRYLVYCYDTTSIHTVTRDINTRELLHVNIALENLDSYSVFFI